MMQKKEKMMQFFDLKTDFSVINGDVASELEKIPDNTFNLILTSPPYNIGKSYEKKIALDEYLSFQELIIADLVRVMHPNGSLILQIGNFVRDGEIFPLDFYFYSICKKLNLCLRNRIIWHFEHGLHCQKRLSGRYEVILWFTKSDIYTFNLDSIRVPSKYPNKKHFKGPKKGQLSGNPLGKNPSDFWTILNDEFNLGVFDVPNVKHNHPEKTDHPCQFPIELAERCVLAFTNEADLILDPFGGVGSTLIASLKNKRKVVSIDNNPIYSDIASKRAHDFLNGCLRIREIGTPIYKKEIT